MANPPTSPTLTTLNACLSSSSAASAYNASTEEHQHFSFSPSIANLKLHTSPSSYNHHQRPFQLLHQENHFSSSLNNAASTSSCFISSAISSANVCATGPATANSSYLCSSSAPTMGVSNNSLASHRHSINKLLNTTHNNNTCSINNNCTSTTTTTLCGFKQKSSLTTPPPPSSTAHQQHYFSSSSRGFAGLFCSNSSRSTSKIDVNESLTSPHHILQPHYQHPQQQSDHHHHHLQQQHQHNNFDNQQKPLKSSDSLSDVSDTFDWWFQKHKRNSQKKNRYITKTTLENEFKNIHFDTKKKLLNNIPSIISYSIINIFFF